MLTLHGHSNIQAKVYGNKASNLQRIARLGLRTPPGIAIAADDEPAISEILDALFLSGDELEPLQRRLAVRSSGLFEDGIEASHAGSALTVLGVQTASRLRSAIDEVRYSGSESCGVIVQVMIEASFSGVAFSTNPLTFARGHKLLTYTRGLGHKLVSGDVAAETFHISDPACSQKWPGEPPTLGMLVESLDLLEDSFAHPVDVEWCLTGQMDEIVILQARPVVLPPSGSISLTTPQDFDRLPSILRGHSKLALREKAAREGMPMSPARIRMSSGSGATDSTVAARTSDEQTVGKSVVLIFPERIQDRIIREFSPIGGSDIEVFTTGCRRYEIRRYPAFASTAITEENVLTRGHSSSWFSASLTQDILDAETTGIFRATEDGFLMEIALGHFVPKGYVSTSVFTLSRTGKVQRSHITAQEKVYHFVNGHVVIENKNSQTFPYSEVEITKIAASLCSFAEREPGMALEFGVMRTGGNLFTYLIDAAESDVGGQLKLDALDVQRGVISPGKAIGEIVDLTTRTAEDLNAHFYDRAAATAISAQLFLAPRASVDLLPLVNACDSGSGFIFAEASLLAHLPVVLREKGIAAVEVGREKFLSMRSAQHGWIDTSRTDEVCGGH